MTKTTITNSEILELEQRKRANLINSIGGFKSICLVGTMDKSGQTNLAIFNSVVHIGANPPYIGLIVRPDSVERHTLSNIMETGFYTLNHINAEFFQQAHQTSARYPKQVSEFEAAGLTKEFKNDFGAPFVMESHLQMAVALKDRIDIQLNGTILIIGEIQQIHYPADCMGDDGYMDLEKAGTICCSGLDSYHVTQKIERLPYAKP